MTSPTRNDESRRFDEIAEPVRDKIDNPADSTSDRYVGLEHLDPGSLKIRRWGHVTDVESTKIVFRSGDVIFGKRRAYQRKLAIADFDGICSAHAMVLRPKTDVVLPRFLPHFMESDAFMSRAVKISVGGLSPTINWTDLAQERFDLPSLAEQARLIVPLDALEDALEKLRSLEVALGGLLNSLSEDLVGRRSEVLPLASVATLDIQKITVVEGQSYRHAGVLNEGKGLFKKEDLAGSETKYRTLHRARTGQIVMRKLTAWEGAIGVVEDELDGYALSTEFPTFSIDSDRALPAYLRWVFRRPSFWREMESRCKGTARRRARLHPVDLLKIPVPIPSIAEQERAVEALTQVEEGIRMTRERQNEVRRMKQDFTGLFDADLQELGAWP